ncbi:MAG TPA: inositol monophosphatase family protein [Burkholderiales bacterium]
MVLNRVAADLAGVLAGTVAAAEAEGVLLAAEFLRPEGPRGTNSKAPIDTEMERRLCAALQGLLACRFVGEETGVTPGRDAALADWCWLVDPQDGTTEFLAGRRGGAISIGLLRAGQPVLGVVHAPCPPDRDADTIAWAKGCGPVRRNGAPCAQRLERGALSAGGFVWASASAAVRPRSFARAAHPARVIALPSIAYRLARVAAGDGVATVSTHAISEYDIAAGAALISGAGGVLLDHDGRSVRFTGTEGARVNGCAAGAPAAAAKLARFPWASLHEETRRTRRVSTAFPKVADALRLSRAHGVLLGQLVGDSLGSLVEFRDAASIRRQYPDGVRNLADGGSWDTIAGQPTDDSEMALALARAIVARGGFAPDAARDAYQEWFRSAPFDIGGTTRAGLSGRPNAASEANGALMRVSPIGVWAAGDPARAASAAREDAALTHPNPVCVAASAAFAAAIAVGTAGDDAAAMGAAARAQADGPAREAIEAGAAGEPPADFQRHQGWVCVALQNAFYRLLHSPSLEVGLIDTVGAGGDTDTNAAIAGALLGAAHGRAAFPLRWVLPVLACRALAEAGAKKPRPEAYWPDDALELAEALLRAGAR